MATGRAKMHPMNQSGVKGVINFTDDGSTLTITGTATGLVPFGGYFTLIYDNGSVPGGPEACEPSIFVSTDPDFIIPTMEVGSWVVDAEGNGTLNAVNTNDGEDYVPLSKIKTISIRQLPTFPLVACGEEATHKAGK
jgi:hypothetical protein